MSCLTLRDQLSGSSVARCEGVRLLLQCGQGVPGSGALEPLALGEWCQPSMARARFQTQLESLVCGPVLEGCMAGNWREVAI